MAVLLAGGGIRRGVAYGRTDDCGMAPTVDDGAVKPQAPASTPR
jgi:hypothetical protein